jgi:hypothetical protein
VDPIKRELWVEGEDEIHVFKHICNIRNITPKFTSLSQRGLPNLLASLPVTIRLGEDGDRLGIVLDADLDIAARWTQVRTILQGLGFPSIPPAPEPAGTIIRSVGLPTVGVWIMPDNTIPGMLEDFLAVLVPSGDMLWPQAEKCVEEAARIDRRFNPDHATKAKIHTYLAWQSEPGVRLGRAISLRCFEANNPLVDSFLDWLDRLFA